MNRSASMGWTRREFTGSLAAAGLFSASPTLRGEPAAGRGKIRLITRADDIGCARSLNRAVLECFQKGIARNGSVLAPAPFVEEAAKSMAGLKEVCFGLHSAVTSEWDRLRWGPVSDPASVPSLVDSNGHLHQTNDAVAKSATKDDVFRELDAQLAKARRLGFDIRYADAHMGSVFLVAGVREHWAAWCNANGLVDVRGLGPGIPGLPNPWNNPGHRREGDYVEQLMTALRAAPAGQYLVVGHCAYPDEEILQLGHPGYPPDAVAHNLDWERRGFTDPRIVAFCREEGIEAVRMDEAKPG